MKIIAFYLPQFHAIKENDEWWGEGFTEWENLKTAKPTFKGQYQPRIPLHKNYYNLTEVKTLEWQADLAKKYGVYGFCYYHYWSEGHMLLEKPAEIMLENKSVDQPFCFCWANHDWTRAWADKQNEMLWEQKYGDKEDWKAHFEYLLPFFKDERYIRVNGKPFFVVYDPLGVKEFPPMMEYWQQLARESGLEGITFAHQRVNFDHNKEIDGKPYDFGIEYQLSAAINEVVAKRISFLIQRVLNRIADKMSFLRCKATTIHYSYDDIWNIVLNMKPQGDGWIPGAFVDWDNTPRRKNRGTMCTGVTPEKFQKYLTRQIKRAKEVYNSEYLFMFAWNEWGESGYLEPDEKNEYAMLEAVKKALEENNEFPKVF